MAQYREANLRQNAHYHQRNDAAQECEENYHTAPCWWRKINSQKKVIRCSAKNCPCKMRSDQDIAKVLSRMRADDVADTIMDLPQSRRRSVLDLLPPAQHTKVLALLGYHEATAGGLMGTDYLALQEEQSIADAIGELRAATMQQPEALTTIHTLRSDGTLAGTLSLVRALQLNPMTVLREAADPRVVVASPEDDIIAITTRMADFNLLSLPVVDPSGRMLGIVTVDDALEAAIQRDWFQRKSS